MTILIFIIILAILVFVHELGHFATAKRFGMRVEEFGFGFPPRAKKLFEKNGTLYTLNWLPLGGFVKIKGESGDYRNEQDSFASKKAWQRLVVLVAGVTMNIVLAWALFTVGYSIGLPQVVDNANEKFIRDKSIQIIALEPDSPAIQADLQVGDKIISIDNNHYEDITEIQNYINSKNNQAVNLNIARGGNSFEKTITPTTNTAGERAVMGVALVKTGIISYPWYQALWEGLKTTIFTTWQIILAFGGMLKSLFITGSLGADIAGPVGIAVLTGQVVNLGFIYILQFAALLSINLAIINILPIPALDGGRVLFLAIEKIIRRPVNQKIEAIVHNIGFLLLMLLVVIVTFKDIGRFTSWWEKLANIF